MVTWIASKHRCMVLPLALTVPAKAELVCVVVAVLQILRGNLASASLTVGVGISMFLRYLDTFLPEHHMEVIPEADS